MNPHQIRLAGPWEWRPVMSGDEIAVKSAVTRCQLPFRAGCDSSVNAVGLHRGFHSPTGIDGRTSIFLVLDVSGIAASTGPYSIAALIAVSLNGQPVPVANVEHHRESETVSQSETMRMAFDISGLLEPFNDLHVVLSAIPQSATALDAACLEIHDRG